MSSTKRLAREILDTRRLALGHATSPQLTSSAVDGGGIDFRDAEGNPIAGIGVGDDGGLIIDYTGGPKPPKPSPPTVTADAGIFRIEWDGSFVNEGDEGVLATSDTDRVEIHASMDENFVPDRVESFGGAFATLDGGSFTLGPLPEAGTYYFRLVARSKSAQFSEPSDRVEQELAITSIDLEITDAWLTGEAAQNTADGKNSIFRGPDEPEPDPDKPFKDGDIWFEMTDDGKSIPNIWDEAAGAWVGNDDYRQSEIERVQQELRQDLDTVITDGSGTKNFFRPTAPAASEASEGDLWFDSSADGKNTPHVFQDGAWVSAADQRVADIKAAQDELRQDLNEVVENGVGTNTHYTPTMPSTAVSKEGDLWFDPSDDNKPYIFQGGKWITVRDSFAPPGAGQNVFALLDAVGSTPNAIDNQWSNVDGFTLTPGPFGCEAKVPSGAATGTATIRLPLAGTFNAAGEWQLSADEVIDPNGLGLGVSGTVEFYSPGATPTAKVALRVLVPDTGMIDVEQPLTVVDDVFGNSQTHSVDFDSEQLTVLGLYPTVYAWSLYLEVSVDSVPGNMVEAGFNIAYAVSSQGIAPNAVTGTTIADDSISTPKLQAKAITTDKIAAGAITAESGVIGSIDAGTITVGEMSGARIKANTINADSVLVNGSLGSTVIKDGAITTSKIKAGAITADSGIIGSINAGTITVGEMEGARIKARTLSADRLLIGTGGNLIPWDQVSSGETVEPHRQYGDGAISLEPENSELKLNPHMRVSNSSASGVQLSASFRPAPDLNHSITPGEKMSFSVKAYPISSGTVQVQLRIYWYNLRNAGSGYKGSTSSETVTLTPGKLTEVSVSGPARTDTMFALPYIMVTAGSDVGVAEVDFRRQVGATLIEGGAISTEHIRTGAITAESGIIGSIDANVITVGKIMGNQLDADAVNGKTITGAKIRTASSGSRVELTHNGLKQYNSLGATIVDMTAGSFTLQGGSITGSTIRTSASGGRVEIDSNGFRSYAPDGRATTVIDSATGTVGILGTFSVPSADLMLEMRGFGAARHPGLLFTGTESVFGRSPSSGIGTIGNAGRILTSAYGTGLQITGPHNSSYDPGAWIHLSPDEDGRTSGMYVPTSRGDVGIFATTSFYGEVLLGTAYGADGGSDRIGDLSLGRDSSGARVASAAIYARKYGSGYPLMRITSKGNIGTDNSARRFKVDEQTMATEGYADNLLSVPYKSWVAKEDQRLYEEYLAFREETPIGPVPQALGDAPQEAPVRDIGLVAEDLEDAGVGEFVQYDGFGRTQGVAYDRIAAALIPIIRSLRDRVESLEAQIASA